METVDYHKTWSAIYAERGELISRRTELENELVEIRNSISHLDEILDHLAPLAGLAVAVARYFGLTFTASRIPRNRAAVCRRDLIVSAVTAIVRANSSPKMSAQR